MMGFVESGVRVSVSPGAPEGRPGFGAELGPGLSGALQLREDVLLCSTLGIFNASRLT